MNRLADGVTGGVLAIVVRQIASLDCGIVAVMKRDYDVRAQSRMIVGDRIPVVGMGVHDSACPSVLVAHQHTLASRKMEALRRA
jgi:hypothetical protein